MTDAKDPAPPLGGTTRDIAMSLTKGAVGAVPFAGSILGEIIGTFLPEQRIQRLETYVRYLSQRIDALGVPNDALKTEEAIDLFEDGAFQSARALSAERQEQIASLVSSGLLGDHKERIEAKRLLQLLRQIDDDQIVILASYLHKNQNDEFRAKHAAVLDPVPAHLGSDQEELDSETGFRLARQQLATLGLLRPRFKAPRKNELPEFDTKTGMIKQAGYELTPLGRMLLTRIGLAEVGEF